MIYVLTVHWNDDRWIDVQLKYLQQHLTQPYKVFAFLNEVPAHHNAKFFYASTEPIVAHAIKLNLLADMASFHSDDPDDVLLFIDGDAFPIGDVAAFGREKLQAYPLVAVQRRENNGDVQPHPSFCMTTVELWKKIGGDWKKGFRWNNAQGKAVTDVGGNLLGLLQQHNLDWCPMLRSNKTDIHPLFYGVYEDLVYHHGAGFRTPYSSIDKATRHFSTLDRLGRLLTKPLGKDPKLELFKVIKRAGDPEYRHKAKNSDDSEQVFELIQADPLFYRYFLDADGEPLHRALASAASE